MNKYTLKFICERLENEYQQARQQLTIPIFKVINAICLAASIFTIIIRFIHYDLFSLIIFSCAAFVLIIGQFCIGYYKRHWMDNYILLINHVIMLHQIYLSVGFEAQDAFVFGQNQMIIHIVAILISDFRSAIIQIFGNTIIKIVLAYYFQPSFSYNTVVYAIIVSIMLLFTLQRINQQYRLSFLYTTNDQLQQQLIPVLIDNPFVICSFDENNLSFQVKHSNLQSHALFEKIEDNTICMQHLLRSYKVYGSTLEAFLLSRTKINSKLIVNKTFEIVNSQNPSQKIVIRYSEFNYTDLMFLIIIDQKEQQLQALISKQHILEKGVRNFSVKIQKFLLQQLNIVNRSETNKKFVYQAKVNLMYILTKFEKNQERVIEPFKLLHKVSQFANLYQLAYSKKKVQLYLDSKIQDIVTNSKIFTLLLTLLMKIIFKIRLTDIIIYVCNNCSFEDYFDIAVKVKYTSLLYAALQKSTHFRNTLRQIGPYDYIQLEEDSINLIQLGIIISFYRNLNEINQIRSFKFEVITD